MGCNKELNSGSLERKTKKNSDWVVYLKSRYTVVTGEAGGAVSRVGTIYNGSVRSRKSSRTADYTRPAGD